MQIQTAQFAGQYMADYYCFVDSAANAKLFMRTDSDANLQTVIKNAERNVDFREEAIKSSWRKRLRLN